MNTFYAIDLVPHPKYRKLWCHHGKLETAAPESDLPAGGLVLLLGFICFTRHPRRAALKPDYTITFNEEVEKIPPLGEKGGKKSTGGARSSR